MFWGLSRRLLDKGAGSVVHHRHCLSRTCMRSPVSFKLYGLEFLLAHLICCKSTLFCQTRTALRSVLEGQSWWDLVDIDAQGAEHNLLRGLTSWLADRVRRLHVSTHSPKMPDWFSLLGTVI